jgi:hypothetical protein
VCVGGWVASIVKLFVLEFDSMRPTTGNKELTDGVCRKVDIPPPPPPSPASQQPGRPDETGLDTDRDVSEQSAEWKHFAICFFAPLTVRSYRTNSENPNQILRAP